MNIRIIKTGVMDTIQDGGRHGWQQLGINPGGAMDIFSMQMANILAGNKRNEAVIEIHFPAGEFFFEQPALITIAGADFTACINGEEIATGQPVIVSRFSILQFTKLKTGARAYLSVYGGFQLPAWLDSYSTNLKAAVGGYKGRSLQKDDEISIRSLPVELLRLTEKKEFHLLPWKAADNRSETDKTIWVLPGHEMEWLDKKSGTGLFKQAFTITAQSDRMGYRLKGNKLATVTNDEVISSAVDFGTVQLLPDGQLIVLMADHQTTGGYPRIAHVISASRPALAQLKAGDKILFQLTDHDKAEQLLMKQEQHLQQLENACQFKWQQLLKA